MHGTQLIIGLVSSGLCLSAILGLMGVVVWHLFFRRR